MLKLFGEDMVPHIKPSMLTSFQHRTPAGKSQGRLRDQTTGSSLGGEAAVLFIHHILHVQLTAVWLPIYTKYQIFRYYTHFRD